METNSSPVETVTTASTITDNSEEEKAAAVSDEIDANNLMVIESTVAISSETVEIDTVDDEDDDDEDCDENIVVDINVKSELTDMGLVNESTLPELSVIKKKTEKAKWSSEEDEILKRAVALHGVYHCIFVHVYSCTHLFSQTCTFPYVIP